MNLDYLITICKQFKPNTEMLRSEELASGHINDTFLLIAAQKPYYILQRINHNVFKDVPGLINNKVQVSRHLTKKRSHLTEKQLTRSVLSFVSTKEDKAFYQDSNGDFWNVMVYIDESKTFETVHEEVVAYEGGKLFGEFLNLTSDFDPSQLIEVIPQFHDMSFRFSQFDASLKVASNELCVIDTDTVMPGIIHYDFGDAIRTICNTAAEDETNLELVEFNEPFYHAYLKGFLEKTASSITELELKYLPLGAKTMIFIMAIRFLTDYLNGDIYYKTKYPEHNLDRSKNKLKLIQSFSEKISI